MAETDTDLCSLWLVPDAPAVQALTARIATFTPITGTPAFTPHVTLAGDLPRPPSELEPLLNEIAQNTATLSTAVCEIVHGPEFFKSLFLRLDMTPELSALRKRVSVLHPTIDLASFDPHVSLAYGDIPESKRQAATGDLHGWIGQTLSFSAISLVHSSAKTPIEDWHILQQFPLQTQS